MKSQKTNKSVKTKQTKKMFYEKVTERYIDPFTDFGFKKLFGEECNKDLLLDFLNELLHKEEGRIVSLSYLKSEKLGFSENSRKAIFDLYCENEKGEKFIVELQKAKQDFFKDRTLFYSTFPITEQAPSGDWNFELKSVYTIAILNFVFDEDKNDPLKYRYDVMLSDIETHEVFYDKLTFIYLEMPKFTKEIDELDTRFEKWMYVIKNLKRLDEIPNTLRERIFEKMFAAAEVAKLTHIEYVSYVDSVNAYRDWNNCMNTAIREGTEKAVAKVVEKAVAEAVAKATEDAKVEARAEGLAEGRMEGRMEGERERAKLQQEIETLKKLLGK
jgi:predicted transposase/invertase (TIGR01784 family)